MPVVRGKEFPYTPQGMRRADEERQKDGVTRKKTTYPEFSKQRTRSQPLQNMAPQSPPSLNASGVQGNPGAPSLQNPANAQLLTPLQGSAMTPEGIQQKMATIREMLIKLGVNPDQLS
jgi:hemolysin activation/secretion protein